MSKRCEWEVCTRDVYGEWAICYSGALHLAFKRFIQYSIGMVPSHASPKTTPEFSTHPSSSDTYVPELLTIYGVIHLRTSYIHRSGLIMSNDVGSGVVHTLKPRRSHMFHMSGEMSFAFPHVMNALQPGQESSDILYFHPHIQGRMLTGDGNH